MDRVNISEPYVEVSWTSFIDVDVTRLKQL